MLRKLLLISGIASSLLYVAMNIIAAAMYEGYSSVSQTVSELSAIGSPTRPVWVGMAIFYGLLLIAFGIGVWFSAGRRPALRTIGALIIVQAIFGVFWPPMHIRGAQFSLTDTLHIVFTFITVPMMIAAIVSSAFVFGNRFRIYAIGTLVVLVAFGILTGLDGPNIAADRPTPFVGIWERISIGAFMLWVVVLTLRLLRERKAHELGREFPS